MQIYITKTNKRPIATWFSIHQLVLIRNLCNAQAQLFNLLSGASYYFDWLFSLWSQQTKFNTFKTHFRYWTCVSKWLRGGLLIPKMTAKRSVHSRLLLLLELRVWSFMQFSCHEFLSSIQWRRKQLQLAFLGSKSPR